MCCLQVDEAVHGFAVLEGDHLTYVNVYNSFLDAGKNRQWCGAHCISFRALSRACETRRQMRRYIQAWLPPGATIQSAGEDHDTVRRCIVAGFFSHVAQLQPDTSYRTVRDGRRVVVHPSSVLFRFGQTPEWVVFHEVCTRYGVVCDT